MQEITVSNTQQIRVPATLDVQAVERELSDLWKRHAGAAEVDEESAVMRARVMNLMVYVPAQASLGEVEEVLREVTVAHPCRALLMAGERESATDQDIEMFVSSYCQAGDSGGGRQLCCEQVTLIARGRYAVELPSAATPLLVSDLPVFLWWREPESLSDQTFAALSDAADRVVIDSAVFRRSNEDLKTLAALFKSEHEALAVSDLNWSRLTYWRELLAGFFDAPESRATLERISRARIEYVAPEGAPQAIAPQALIFAGWLASRLDWRAGEVTARGESRAEKDGALAVSMQKQARRIKIEFQKVERPEMKQGRLARVELSAEDEPSISFVVLRSADGCRLETQSIVGSSGEVRGARVLECRNRSEAALLSRELEILSHDRIYEQALVAAAEMI